MVDIFYDRINDYGSVTIKLASPADIRSWSFGEVKKPETINYRTYRAEKDGLFCERIFGPEKDWECYCGKYKGIKYKGIVCDRCGVKVAHSKVRRKRMGHINLASPVAHIWFFKAMPSRISNLLGIKTAHIERVIYFQDYIVIDPGDTGLKKCELLSEDKLRDAQAIHGEHSFKVGMGAEAIQELLRNLDLRELAETLQRDYEDTGSKQKQKELIKRLELTKMIFESGNRPEWMILEAIPVIPPDLRPLVLLDSGNFATSDLNDLYRRLINRNNRLKKLLDMNAPDVIIRNEKRMLQQSVDALFDNSRCRRPVVGTGNRPMKSLTDMIKGKQGRFRENLLGKRVDYSARSVIVVGPDLKLHQCGIPKKIALELFQPFIIRRLKELGHADTIKSAKKMLERKDKEVWDILEDVIKNHPVLLNRAPTLHRMGIQAFVPILTEGNAIKLHPLVCSGFNADFDGDQMAVHLPLSIEAQVEARTLMLSVNNIFSPSNGQPIIAPSQDIVLGCYYMTISRELDLPNVPIMCGYDEVFLAYMHKKASFRTAIWLELPEDMRVDPPTAEENLQGHNTIKTTVGRAIFNSMLPEGMPYYNKALNKKAVISIISECERILGRQATLKLLDDIKQLGFRASTLGGISIAKNYLLIPPQKGEIIAKSEEKVARIESAYTEGAITDKERYNSIIDCWTQAREQVGQVMMKCLENDRGDDGNSYNPLYMMASSGARGSLEQIRQLAGMRGLMAKPSGAIIETPIIANFREGLRVLEYFSSTHGARKGLADTALKTADSGYLTRKLADVAQNVVINEDDCGTINGITKGAVIQGDKVTVPLSQNIMGRVSRDTIYNKQTGEVVCHENDLINDEIGRKIEALGLEKIRVRSPLTCETPVGVCSICYGMDLSRGKPAEPGLAAGIIAAQSIGEPGTQLTMRTFHIGGIAMKDRQETDISIPLRGTRVTLSFKDLKIAQNREKDHVVIDGNGSIMMVHEEVIDIPVGATLNVIKGQQVVPNTDSEVVATKRRSEIKATMLGMVSIEGKFDKDGKAKDSSCKVIVTAEEELKIPLGSVLCSISGKKSVVKNGMTLEAGVTKKKKNLIKIAECDPHNVPIFAEVDGYAFYDDIIADVTMRVEPKGKVIIEHKGERHPSIIIKDEDGKPVAICALPEKAYIGVNDGEKITAGTLLAKKPREVSGTQDITGGLPRVTEVLEARRPKNATVISEIDGVVEIGEKRRGKRTVVVVNKESGLRREHLVPHGKHLEVRGGDYVKSGDALVDGPKIPHDILRCCGVGPLQQYLLEEIQKVYWAQSVMIDDKHIEIIIGQMMRKVKVDKPGDTEFLPGEVVDKFRFHDVNKKTRASGKKTATYKPLLLGITKASLQSDSFISAASFQETTKVLTEAALAGKRDELLGLKENVILGHMVPAGTGFKYHSHTRVDRVEDEKKADDESEQFETAS